MSKLFEIFRVNNSVVKELIKAPNLPHQHNHEEIIVVIKGTLEHFIDFESNILSAPFVSFITKGKTHRIKPVFNSEESDGFIIRFQSEFVSSTIFQLYHLFHDNANVVFSTSREFKRFVTLCHLLQEETKQDSSDYTIIKSMLNTLLTILYSEKSRSRNVDSSNHQDSIFLKFLELLEENYHHSISTSFYAEKLHMSSRNLNLICQRILQQSITEIIQTRKLIQARNLLTTTDKTIKEIGIAIGYNEKSYFSNIFKKKIGKTPSEFRSEIGALFS